MIEMPFSAPHGYVGAVPAPAAPVAGFWFVFRGDRLLVEAGEPATGKPDDPRAWPRPSWARLPMTTTPRARAGAAAHALSRSARPRALLRRRGSDRRAGTAGQRLARPAGALHRVGRRALRARRSRVAARRVGPDSPVLRSLRHADRAADDRALARMP